MTIIEFSEREKFFCDWSMRRGICALRNHEERAIRYDTLRDLLEAIEGLNAVIVIECSFESLDVKVAKPEFIKKCASSGHVLLTVSPRRTSWVRIRMGLPSKRDKNGQINKEYTEKDHDEFDAMAIREMCLRERSELWRPGSEEHLKIPVIFSDDSYRDRFDAAALELMTLRSTGENETGPRGGEKWISYKNLIAEGVINKLPPIDKAFSHRDRPCVANPDGSYNTVIAVYVAAKHAKDKREWERIIGLSSCGYGSQFRSDIMYHGWRARRDTLKLTDYRRNLRRLYFYCKKILGGWQFDWQEYWREQALLHPERYGEMTYPEGISTEQMELF